MHDVYKREVEIARREQKYKKYDGEFCENIKKIQERCDEKDILIEKLTIKSNNNENMESKAKEMEKDIEYLLLEMEKIKLELN